MVRRAVRACALGVAIALVAPLAQAGDPAAAREQLKIGYTLAQAGRCGEALPHLAESLRLDPKAITLINLADCEEKLGRFTDAMSHWVDARARAQTEGNAGIQEEAERRATQLDPRLPRLAITLAPAAPRDALIERDGVVLGPPSIGIALPLDPGPHSVVVKARGRAASKVLVTLREGESRQLEVDAGAPSPSPGLEPAREADAPPAGGRVPALAIVGFAVAGVGLAVGSVTGALALAAGREAEAACPARRCSRAALDDVEAGRTVGTVSTIGFVAAAVGAAVGIYALVTRPAAAAPRPSSRAPGWPFTF